MAHDRVPAINVYEAVRYMAAGVMAHKSALRGALSWMSLIGATRHADAHGLLRA